MPARLESIGLVGLGAQPVIVEVDIAAGLPGMTIVGLADKAVDEARERVKAAIRNSGFQFPVHKITVNLAPADLPKYGPAYDLPIALGILLASGVIQSESLEGAMTVGELALSGEIRPVDGILPMLLAVKRHPPAMIILPAANRAEARLVEGLPLAPAHHLRALVEGLTSGADLIDRSPPSPPSFLNPIQLVDLAHIGGLEQVKRALEIAAAGNHNLLMIGPPGTGKTLLARAFAALLPELEPDEHLEVLTIRSAAGLLKSEELSSRLRPVRSPHHTASPVALVGGGTKLRPGEVSLAHRGVLFLDELPEFPRSVLEALREPLEEGKITIARAQGAITFPARFTLIAAANPCPCGYFSDPDRPCQCSPYQLLNYQRKLSGPLLDRIDLVMTVPRQAATVLLDQPIGERSETVRERVLSARRRQKERYTRTLYQTNADLTAASIKIYVPLNPQAKQVLTDAGDRLHLSGRAMHRVLKVSRTIADLAGQDEIDPSHIAEALQYRSVDALRSS